MCTNLTLGLSLLALLLLLGLLSLGLHALDLDRVGVHSSVGHARDRGLDLVDLHQVSVETARGGELGRFVKVVRMLDGLTVLQAKSSNSQVMVARQRKALAQTLAIHTLRRKSSTSAFLMPVRFSRLSMSSGL